MKLTHTLTLFVASSFSLIVTASLVGAVTTPAGPQPVDLGTASNYVILSKAGVSTTGVTSIVGDIGVSPNDSTSLTGFSLSLDPTTQFATSPQITGKAFAADYTVPTPTNLTTAIGDMQTAYTNAAGRTLPTTTELGAGNISGMTIAPGLHKWSSGLLLTSDVALSGGPNDIWIFQIAQNLTIESGVILILSGGAQSGNIFWQVAGEVNIGTTAHFEGNILCQTAINLKTGASINGRLLAQTAVTLDSNTINLPVNGTGWSQGATSLENNWNYLEWFGYYYAPKGPDYEWIWHAQLGWLYPTGTSPQNIWFSTYFMGWIWSSNTTYPYFWRENDQTWLYYTIGSTLPRWFYNSKTSEWETY